MHSHTSASAAPTRSTMLKVSALLAVAASLVLTASGVAAAPVNKCVVNGTVTYQQGPCPSDQIRKPPTIEELNAEARKRRAAVLLTNEALCRSEVLPRQLPWGKDGRRQEWNPLRAAVVQPLAPVHRSA